MLYSGIELHLSANVISGWSSFPCCHCLVKIVRACFSMCCVSGVFICNSPVFDYRTPLGRGRAWLRLALMQKKLSDYMKTIINRKDLLRCVYHSVLGPPHIENNPLTPFSTRYTLMLKQKQFSGQ